MAYRAKGHQRSIIAKTAAVTALTVAALVAATQPAGAISLPKKDSCWLATFLAPACAATKTGVRVIKAGDKAAKTTGNAVDAGGNVIDGAKDVTGSIKNFTGEMKTRSDEWKAQQEAARLARAKADAAAAKKAKTYPACGAGVTGPCRIDPAAGTYTPTTPPANATANVPPCEPGVVRVCKIG